MKKKNPNSRNSLIQTRVSNAELQDILAKSFVLTNGNVSEYVRLACLHYKTLKKVKV